MGLLLPFPILVDPRLQNVKSRLKIPIRIRGNKFDSKSGSVGITHILRIRFRTSESELTPQKKGKIGFQLPLPIEMKYLRKPILVLVVESGVKLRVYTPCTLVRNEPFSCSVLGLYRPVTSSNKFFVHCQKKYKVCQNFKNQWKQQVGNVHLCSAIKLCIK